MLQHSYLRYKTLLSNKPGSHTQMWDVHDSKASHESLNEGNHCKETAEQQSHFHSDNSAEAQLPYSRRAATSQKAVAICKAKPFHLDEPEVLFPLDKLIQTRVLILWFCLLNHFRILQLVDLIFSCPNHRDVKREIFNKIRKSGKEDKLLSH